MAHLTSVLLIAVIGLSLTFGLQNSIIFPGSTRSSIVTKFEDRNGVSLYFEFSNFYSLILFNHISSTQICRPGDRRQRVTGKIRIRKVLPIEIRSSGPLAVTREIRRTLFRTRIILIFRGLKMIWNPERTQPMRCPRKARRPERNCPAWMICRTIFRRPTKFIESAICCDFWALKRNAKTMEA